MILKQGNGKPSWHWGRAPLLTLPCGHEALVLPEWIAPDGTIADRISCGEAGCRQSFAGIVLEGYAL